MTTAWLVNAEGWMGVESTQKELRIVRDGEKPPTEGPDRLSQVDETEEAEDPATMRNRQVVSAYICNRAILVSSMGRRKLRTL